MGHSGSRASFAGIAVSHNGVWRCLKRHGLNTRAKRLSLVAGYAAPYQPPREPAPQRHVEAERPGELVGVDCFFVGRLSGTKGAVWQLTAIDVASSFAWAELVTCPRGNPTGLQTSKLARRVAAELATAGWRLERVLSDNGGEFRARDFRDTLRDLGVKHTLIRAGRPQTNGAVEALHRLILEECWRPAFARYLHVRFTGLQRDLADYIDDYNFHRAHNGRLTRGRIPADIVYGAHKVKTR
jgi:transposase InsO family protein